MITVTKDETEATYRRQRFTRLAHRYQHRVFGFACYYLDDRAEAEDVTQEVLLRLWRHEAAVEEERLANWLLRVTRNACIDALRRRRAQRKVFRPDAPDFEQVDGRAPRPDADAEAADFSRQLQHALAGLDDPYRSIVILREIQELKYEEISDALNLPLNTVKVYLHRARKQLRALLQEVMERETA